MTMLSTIPALQRSGYALPGLKLPGVSPSPLGAAPAVWLLQGNAGTHVPVGVLLMQVLQPLTAASTGSAQLQLAKPSLRVLVYCRRDGSLLRVKDAPGAASSPLQPHPRFGLPCWDSG